MRNLIDNKSAGSSMRRRIGQAISSGLVVLAMQLPIAAHGQVAPTPITPGQLVQGTLAPTDRILADGRPVDTYTITTQAPGQTYLVFATSPGIPLESSLILVNAAQQPVPLQLTHNFLPNQTLGYFGTVDQPGRLLISVYAQDLQRPNGGYFFNVDILPPPPPAQ